MPGSTSKKSLPNLEKAPNQRIGDALADLLRDRIATMSVGDQMPSVRQLMRRYNVSMLPVTQALKQLESENLILAIKGKGTFISPQRHDKLIMLHRSFYNSSSESKRERNVREAIKRVEGWNFVARYHESIPQSPASFEEEPIASAHIVACDLSHLRPDLLRELAEQKVPVLLIDNVSPHGANFDTLAIDESQVFMRSLEYLRDLGHRKTAWLLNEPHFHNNEGHDERFLKSLDQLGLPPGLILDCDTVPGTSSREMAYRHLRGYFAALDGALPFTALIVGSPSGGIGALRACHDFGVRVPEDLTLVVITGTVLENRLCVPALTEAFRSNYLESEYIVRILKARFAGAEPADHRMDVRMDLAERESSGPPPPSPVVPRELKPSVL
ncbi:MAG: substrate-binding domain-containing protein [Verrucomicrobiota bacterium]